MDENKYENIRLDDKNRMTSPKDESGGKVNKAFLKDEEQSAVTGGNWDQKENLRGKSNEDEGRTLVSSAKRVITQQPTSASDVNVDLREGDVEAAAATTTEGEDAEPELPEVKEDKSPKSLSESVFDIISNLITLGGLIAELVFNIQVYINAGSLGALGNSCGESFRVPWLIFTIAGFLLGLLQLANVITGTIFDLCRRGIFSIEVDIETFVFNIFKNLPHLALGLYYLFGCQCFYTGGGSALEGVSVGITMSVVIAYVRTRVRDIFRIRRLKFYRAKYEQRKEIKRRERIKRKREEEERRRKKKEEPCCTWTCLFCCWKCADCKFECLCTNKCWNELCCVHDCSVCCWKCDNCKYECYLCKGCCEKAEKEEPVVEVVVVKMTFKENVPKYNVNAFFLSTVALLVFIGSFLYFRSNRPLQDCKLPSELYFWD